jgi:hypothetical protein
VKVVKLFVEGGGDSNSLRIECRAAFSSFLQKAGLRDRMPRIIACGSRNGAYGDYCAALGKGEEAALLVDSEGPVLAPQGDAGYSADNQETWRPWHHLKNRLAQNGRCADNWEKPQNAQEEDCHLMVQVMEAWFLADLDSLRKYYGQGFNENCLPQQPNIENIAKDDLFVALRNAARATQKGHYDKGRHSFQILKIVDSQKVTNKSPWAKRFVDLLTAKMQKARLPEE